MGGQPFGFGKGDGGFANRLATDCVPCDATRLEHFEADRLNQLVGK